MTDAMLLGGVEAGGTKFICAVGKHPAEIIERASIATTTPDETLGAVCDFFSSMSETHGPLKAIGVGAFGPVDLSQRSKTYGQILSTPKAKWRNADILTPLRLRMGGSLSLDTDVNCALLGEARYGAGEGEKNIAYVTIGTGVGAGLMINGDIVHGESHPELGHMFVPKHPIDADFAGVCDYHRDRCVEGLASGPAIMARHGVKADEIPEEDPVWRAVAYYISILCMNVFLCVSPAKIILGGGVMQRSHLFDMIRHAFAESLNDYYGARSFRSLDEFIVPARLGGNAGVVGAMTMAAERTSL